MKEKEISFEEALKLPEGTRIRGLSETGFSIEGTTGGSFYNDGHHVGFIRDNGTHDGFAKICFPYIFILSDDLSTEEECSNDLCPDCGVKLEWVNLASKCPKCWRVICG
jgi:hypothetical protein